MAKVTDEEREAKLDELARKEGHGLQRALEKHYAAGAGKGSEAAEGGRG